MSCIYEQTEDLGPVAAVCLLLCIKQSQSNVLFHSFIPQMTMLLQRLLTYNKPISNLTRVRIFKIFHYIYQFLQKMHEHQEDVEREEIPVASEFIPQTFIK